VLEGEIAKRSQFHGGDAETLRRIIRGEEIGGIRARGGIEAESAETAENAENKDNEGERKRA
jgi:hypothetical protein